MVAGSVVVLNCRGPRVIDRDGLAVTMTPGRAEMRATPWHLVDGGAAACPLGMTGAAPGGTTPMT
jgi:hypothetical protein